MANNSMGTKKVEELLVSKSMPLGMQFYVPNYQRGYRWKESQVQQLLNDIKEFDYEKNNEKKFYCLQPLVVTEDKENGWVVIDGQQRLTTLFIILTCIERKLICQCCGMPLEDDEMIGRDKDGSINEDYCKWCYADGTYTYSDMEDLINVCVKNMVTDNFTEEQARSYMKELLPKLDYWKRYDELSDHGEFEKFKKKLLKEINALHVEGLPEITRLNALVGKYVNLEYTLPNGRNVKFLDDQTTYLGTQSESEFEGDRYFGVLAGMDFILICTYEADRTSPELVLYKKR